MKSCLGCCNQRSCAASCSGCSLFELSSEKSELHFVVIYVGMRWVVQKNLWPAFAGNAGSQQLMACGPSNHFWHFSAFNSPTFCSNILLDDLATRAAFCSNTRLHKHFVEPTASPSRWAPKSSILFFWWRGFKKKNGTDLVSKQINWNSSCALSCVKMLCFLKTGNRASSTVSHL